MILCQFILLNAVIDWALSSLDNRLGINLADGVYINHLAFADDIALLSRTPAGLQSQINVLSEHLTKCGLFISAGQNGKSMWMGRGRNGSSIPATIYTWAEMLFMLKVLLKLVSTWVYPFLLKGWSPR